MSDSALAEKIIRQVEYYFSDINLNKDKFMQEEIQKDSGWVSFETLIKFNRLKQLTTDFKQITDSLKQSDSNLLEIDEANNKIRRAKPLPENLAEFETMLKQNTIYVKGFPTTLSLDELIEFFKSHGKVLQVFMRRFPANKQFKGSVFVTFETHEQMKQFLETEELKYNDVVLEKESQEDYIKRKGPDFEKYKEAKKKKEQQKEEKLKQQKEAEEAYLKQQLVHGALLHLKNINEEGTRENIKELFDNFCKVKYVDFNKGLTEAFVRFAEENNAKEALEKAQVNGELTLKGAKLEARVLEGEEEREYWKSILRKFSDMKNKGKRKKGGRNGQNKKWNSNGKKRALNEDDNDGGENDSDGDNDEVENLNGSNKKIKA